MKRNTWVQKIYINKAGYASNGTYFGIGDPVYSYVFEEGKEFENGFIRAKSREEAEEKVLSILQNIFGKNVPVKFSARKKREENIA